MVVEFLQVKNCCGYMPLASGAKFFGFLSLSGCLLLLLVGTLDISYMIRTEFPMVHIVETLVDLVTQMIQGATATLLLLGVYQRKAKLIPYWLITTPIVAALELTILRNVTLRFFQIQSFDLEWYILNSITVVDDVYGWVIVYSYYQTLLSPDAAPV